MKTISNLIFITILSVYICPEFVLAQTSAIRWSSFNSGSDASSRSTTILNSSTGQLLVGASQQTNNRVENGFLSAYLVGNLIVGVEEQTELPSTFSLSQNYPNPFNPATTIRYKLPERNKVLLTVYNTLGQQVARLVDQEIEPGHHEITFDASHLPSGVYIYRLQAGSFVESKKLLLLK
jgi:hypothetical protein